MLGWEYPPHISGGLGTACQGLTTALARENVEVTFVIPHLFGTEDASHMTLVDSFGHSPQQIQARRGGFKGIPRPKPPPKKRGAVSYRMVPSLLQPYFTPDSYREYVRSLRSAVKRRIEFGEDKELTDFFKSLSGAEPDERQLNIKLDHYGGNIFTEVARFTGHVTSLFGRNSEFDLIHCHDWMTYPAGVALARSTGKPLVVHVHSLEYDRSGVHVNEQINQIERLGLYAATRVIAVSYYTRSIVHEQHGIALDKICVVHNGIYSTETVHNYRAKANLADKVVLFLGRITYQKGPDYFVQAAAKVIPHVPGVLFVMAGSGDMLQRMVERVKELGITKHFLFPGFLKGQQVEEMLSIADLYVMPSVSEPFGISALEAIKFDTPVIISKQSGVSEVLLHALKVDFWDVDRMADLMINALLHDELRMDMVSMAREEVRRQHWNAAALKTVDVYRTVLMS